MAKCKRCGDNFDWGWDSQLDRWVPLEKADSEFLSEMPRRFLDDNGDLRADHRDRCGGRRVEIKRLNQPVQPEEVEERQPFLKRIAIASKLTKGSG
jgi:hypothetical protein